MTSWDDPAVIVQGAAVVVAAIAAVAVIWQAVLTRKALSEAEGSLQLARDSLDVAREAQAHTALMSIEALKSRIALNAPSADLEVRSGTLSFLAPSTVSTGFPQPWPEGYVFHVSDGDQPIMVRVAVALRNTGDRTARFVLHGTLREPVHTPLGLELLGTRQGRQDVLLGPDETVHGYWEVTRSLNEWIAIYDARHSDQPGIESNFSVHVDDGQDTGATYSFSLSMGGTAVQPKAPGLRETWVLTGPYAFPTEPDGVGFGRNPVTARYWVSKIQNIPLREGPIEVIGTKR